MKRLSVNKLAAQIFDLERFNLKKLSEVAFWKYLSSVQRMSQSFYYSFQNNQVQGYDKIQFSFFFVCKHISDHSYSTIF